MDPHIIVVAIVIIFLIGYSIYLLTTPSTVEWSSRERPSRERRWQSANSASDHILSFLAYEPAVLPMRYSDGLYWIELILQDPYASAGPGEAAGLSTVAANQPATYRLIADTGSDLIIIPSPSCTDCQGPRWLVQSGAQVKKLDFQGGQEVYYQYAIAYSPTLRQNIQIGVMTAGSTGAGSGETGPAINVFGMMNPSLQLHFVTFDFRGGRILFESGPSLAPAGIVWSPLQRLPYWSLPVTGVPGVDWIILDTGTEFVVVDDGLNLPGGFNFLVGTTQVVVPANLIRKRKALVPRSIVLGNTVMRNYTWIFDFLQLRMAAF